MRVAINRDDRYWVSSLVTCNHCGHQNDLTAEFPVVVLKRTRAHGITSIGFACEQCGTRFIFKRPRDERLSTEFVFEADRS